MCLALCLAVLGGRCGDVQGGVAAREADERVSPAEVEPGEEDVFSMENKVYKSEDVAAGDQLTPLLTPEERQELINQGKDPDAGVYFTPSVTARRETLAQGGRTDGSSAGSPTGLSAEELRQRKNWEPGGPLSYSTQFFHMKEAYVIQDLRMFQSIIKHPLVIVYNYARWCGNCQDFQQQFLEIVDWIDKRYCVDKGTTAKRVLCGNYFPWAVMDVDEPAVAEVKKQENVNMLPCLRLYSRGKMVADCYKDNRHSNQIFSWIKRHEAFLAAPKKIKRIASMGEWKKFTQRHELVAACFAREPVKASKVYNEFALAYNQIHVENPGSKYWAALVTDKALAKELGFKMPRVALFYGRKVQECPLAKKDIGWQALTTWLFRYEFNELGT